MVPSWAVHHDAGEYVTNWNAFLESHVSRAPCDSQVVRFGVRRLEEVSVLWLNDRWFALQGLDVADEAVRAEVTEWLIARFGVISCEEGAGDGLLRAEMYGATNGSIHGGGGRAGGTCGFHAKGIGRTPLAAGNTDFHHSHGSLWLYEAVREIVASEIAAAELPHGAVPIIALLDAHEDVDVHGSSELARRSIVVRPDFVRPAHFERSIFFGTSGTVDSDQVRDVARLRDTVLEAGGGTGRFAGTEFSYDRMFRAIADQIGAGRARRIWQGQFTSSNVAINGAWADFGGFCSMPDWHRAERAHGERFGAEEPGIVNTMKSVAFYLKKHGFGTTPAPWSEEAVRDAISSAFKRTVAEDLSPESLPGVNDASETSDLLWSYYLEQQRVRSVYEDNIVRPWMGDIFGAPRSPAAVSGSESRYRDAFTRSYLDGDAGPFRRILARRFFTSRPDLYQGRADEAFKKASNPTGYGFLFTKSSIRSHIRRSVNRSRRAWPAVPRGICVLSHWQDGAESILLLSDFAGSVRWRITGVGDVLGVRVAGVVIPWPAIERFQIDKAIGIVSTFDLPSDGVSVTQRSCTILGYNVSESVEMVDWR